MKKLHPNQLRFIKELRYLYYEGLKIKSTDPMDFYIMTIPTKSSEEAEYVDYNRFITIINRYVLLNKYNDANADIEIDNTIRILNQIRTGALVHIIERRTFHGNRPRLFKTMSGQNGINRTEALYMSSIVFQYIGNNQYNVIKNRWSADGMTINLKGIAI